MSTPPHTLLRGGSLWNNGTGMTGFNTGCFRAFSVRLKYSRTGVKRRKDVNMDDNTKNTQASAQQDGQKNSEQNSTQQPEKLFTQADVDRIINNRLARMKQDMDTADQYRRERDDARRELEQYKNDAFLASKGVKDADKDYVTFKAMQLVDDNTSFQQVVENFLKENPRFTGRGFTVVSTGSSALNFGSGGASADADIRKAMGLKG